MLQHSRIGIIKVARVNLDNSPEIILRMFTYMEFLPLAISSFSHKGIIEYKGISHKFDIIPEASLIPYYSIKAEYKGSTNIIESLTCEREEV